MESAVTANTPALEAAAREAVRSALEENRDTLNAELGSLLATGEAVIRKLDAFVGGGGEGGEGGQRLGGAQTGLGGQPWQAGGSVGWCLLRGVLFCVSGVCLRSGVPASVRK